GGARTRLLARRGILGPGFRHRSGARSYRFHLRGVRDRAPHVRGAGRQPDVAQYSGEMRLPVERRRTAPLRGAGIVDPGRSLPPLARRLGVAEELEQFDAAPALSVQQVVPALSRDLYSVSFVVGASRRYSLRKIDMPVIMGPGSRPGRRGRYP